MNLIKLVILSLFFFTQVQANTIYNLIKIPNLEIYDIKTPNKLRYLYAKKPFTLGVEKNIEIIENGGWHFAYLQSPQDISKKIKSFAHGEYNKEHIVNEDKIKLKLEKGEDILERGYRIKKIDIDNTFPQYIVDNKNKLKQWIV